jgi:hypothetical protein
MFSPFPNKEAWKGLFLDLCFFKKINSTPYSQAYFQYIVHEFASHFFSIKLDINPFVELNLVEFNSIQAT